MQQISNIKDLVGETLVDIFRNRIDEVYLANRDLPEIKRLTKQHKDIAARLIESNAELYFELEETRNELNDLYEELIYRQGVLDSDEFYKTFKSLGLVSKKEMPLCITEHEQYQEVWDAKTNAYNDLTKVLLDNSLESELEKASILEEKQVELRKLYEEAAYANGVLHGVEEFERIIKKHVTFTKKEEVK